MKQKALVRGLRPALLGAALAVAAAAPARAAPTDAPRPAPPGGDDAPAPAPGAAPSATEVLRAHPQGLRLDEVLTRAVTVASAAGGDRAEYVRVQTDAESAYLLFAPRLDGSLRYLRNSPLDPPNFGGNGQAPGFDFNAFIAEESIAGQAVLTVPASDYFLRIWPTYQALHAAEESARARWAVARVGRQLSAAEAYFGWLRAEASLRVAEASLRTLAAQERDIQQIFSAGGATHADLLQVKASRGNAALQLARAQTNARSARLRLAHWVKTPADRIQNGEALDAPPALTPPPPEADAQAEASKQRPELRAFERLVRSLRKQRQAVFADYLPSISLDGALLHARPNQRVIWDASNFNTTWAVGATARMSPNDAIAAIAARKRLAADIAKAEADRAVTHDNIRVEVTEALRAAALVPERLATSEEVRNAAQGSFEEKKRLYAAGAITILDLLASEQALRQAEIQWVEARLDAHRSKLLFRRALGRPLTEEKGSTP